MTMFCQFLRGPIFYWSCMYIIMLLPQDTPSPTPPGEEAPPPESPQNNFHKTCRELVLVQDLIQVRTYYYHQTTHSAIDTFIIRTLYMYSY